MCQEKTLYAVLYTEDHPDRERTFLGVYGSPELAETAIERHICSETARLPSALMAQHNYEVFEGELNSLYWV